MSFRYTDLADALVRRIDEGIYRTGERLPGIRQTSQNEGVSPATAVAAYRQLEQQGYVEARPRSGFFVCRRLDSKLAEPAPSKPPQQPGPVSGQELVLQLAKDSADRQLIDLGTAIPHPDLLPTQAISKTLASLARERRLALNQYNFPPGSRELRQELTKRLALANCLSSPEDIIITNGCHEALFLSLKTLTQTGDIVAVESPAYHGLLQVIDALGLKALEIPTHPREGMSLDALQLALEQWPVKACVVIPNFSNPLGSQMPDDNKRSLVELVNGYDAVTLIEDDIYGDLAFDGKRPSTLKSYDTRENVILCSSISKTLSPGLRIGWIVSNKHRPMLEYQKYITNTATPTLNQMAVSHLFASGRYDRHLKSLRLALSRNVSSMISCVGEYFPETTRVTRPAGGMVLWVELPASTDVESLRQLALARGISIAPGNLFSPTGRYRQCIRLPCAMPWSEKIEHAMRDLGELIRLQD